MKQRFLVKVKYTKQFDNGTFKRVSESYLFDAESYTDCEAQVYEHLANLIRGEFIIMKMDRFDCDEVILNPTSEGELFFIGKFSYFDMDERELKAKVLIKAGSINEASASLDECIDQYTLTTGIAKSIVETQILDYFTTQEDESTN